MNGILKAIAGALFGPESSAARRYEIQAEVEAMTVEAQFQRMVADFENAEVELRKKILMLDEMLSRITASRSIPTAPEPGDIVAWRYKDGTWLAEPYVEDWKICGPNFVLMRREEFEARVKEFERAEKGEVER